MKRRMPYATPPPRSGSPLSRQISRIREISNYVLRPARAFRARNKHLFVEYRLLRWEPRAHTSARGGFPLTGGVLVDLTASSGRVTWRRGQRPTRVFRCATSNRRSDHRRIAARGRPERMTHYHIEKMAHDLADTRHELWIKCGAHNWAALPTTQDTGEHYCITCLTLFSSRGENSVKHVMQ